jgi:L-arabinokinase
MSAGHGLGHATRVIEVSRHLLDAGHEVTIVSSAALGRHTRHLPQQHFALRDKLLDCGSKQVV